MRKKVHLKRYHFTLIVRSLGIVFFLFVLFVYFFCGGLLKGRYAKLVVVINGEEEGVVVDVYDFSQPKKYSVIIPNQTEVYLPKNLGIWRLGNVWAIGEKEHLGGLLLAQTIEKNWQFPVNAWADRSFLFLSRGNLFSRLKAVFGKYRSSLNAWEKLLLAFFALKLPPGNYETINLSGGNGLKLTTLNDGSLGYRLVNKGNDDRLPGVFVFDELEKASPKIKIVSSGGKAASGALALLIAKMGVKVAYISQGQWDRPEGTCEITSSHEEYLKVLTEVLNCLSVKEKLGDEFDLTIYLGRKHFLSSD